jgi:putative hemolysin
MSTGLDALDSPVPQFWLEAPPWPAIARTSLAGISHCNRGGGDFAAEEQPAKRCAMCVGAALVSAQASQRQHNLDVTGRPKSG